MGILLINATSTPSKQPCHQKQNKTKAKIFNLLKVSPFITELYNKIPSNVPTTSTLHLKKQ
jgi:hypothetical protein